MNEYSNYFEYCVEVKNEGALRLKRFLLVLAYILFPVVLFSVLCLLRLYVLGCFTVILTAILCFFTWRYVQIEYEYIVVKGEMSFSKIFGRRSRREFLKVRIQDMSMLAPYKDSYKARADLIGKKYFAVSSMKSPDIYAAIFKEGKKNEQAVVLFEATSKFVHLAKFYNSAIVVDNPELRY